MSEEANKRIVKLVYNTSDWPLSRQTPGQKGAWGNCLFVENEDVSECDWLVVYYGLTRTEKVLCYAGNTIFIDPEPPTVRQSSSRFFKQFSYVITCRRDVEHPGIINTQQSLPWHIGRMTRPHVRHKELGFTESTVTGFSKCYDDFKNAAFEKTKLLSVISSDKVYTEGHKSRIRFVNALKDHFGDRLDVYGRGINDVEDKWEAIADYKYHIALENSSYEDYWTEKLSDCYLAGAFPFYYGCPNISSYFPEGSYRVVNIDQPEQAIAEIENAIRQSQYENSIGELDSAREMVLDQYNLFPALATLIDNIERASPSGKSKKKITQIKPDGSVPQYRLFVHNILPYPVRAVARHVKTAVLRVSFWKP